MPLADTVAVQDILADIAGQLGIRVIEGPPSCRDSGDPDTMCPMEGKTRHSVQYRRGSRARDSRVCSRAQFGRGACDESAPVALAIRRRR